MQSDKKIEEPDVHDLKNIWKRAEKATIKEIERVTGKSSSIRTITIYPSHFGAKVSFNVSSKLPADVSIFLRFDQNIYTITEGIISSLIQNDLLNTLGANFKEKEVMIDWLVSESSIGKLLQKYESKEKFTPTSEIISKKELSELNRLSKKFLNDLGCPDVKNVNFRLRDGTPFYGLRPVNNLIWQERRVLSQLIKNNGAIFDFGAIGQTIFRDEQEYSPWAIAKFIQRLRDKLEANGISGEHILTVRKRGYVLR